MSVSPIWLNALSTCLDERIVAVLIVVNVVFEVTFLETIGAFGSAINV
ncbi:cell surface domain protein [Bacillus cereus]|nr:cell surface domain protein [Bacillus cereus]KZD56286.1 hypothetical protein B4085_0738 [Bacillus cereus]KZD56957.1 hypothetical protein B4116_4264 [Bacillus cereus]